MTDEDAKAFPESCDVLHAEGPGDGFLNALFAILADWDSSLIPQNAGFRETDDYGGLGKRRNAPAIVLVKRLYYIGWDSA